MIETNKIYNADCLEFMREIEDKSIDLVLTDPPYGIGMDEGFEGFEGFGGFGKPIARKQYIGGWDKERPSKEYFDQIIRVGKLIIIFGGNYFSDLLPRSTHWIVWDKLNTMPTFSDCELIYTNSDRKSVKKYTYLWNGLIGKERFREHPSQKPIALIEKILLNYSKENDLILDPFLGSGTTAIACLNTGRRYIGIEKEKQYFDIADERIKNNPIKLPF